MLVEIGITVKNGSLLHAITVKENKLSKMGVYSMLTERKHDTLKSSVWG